jgi:hypothetical protein
VSSKRSKWARWLRVIRSDLRDLFAWREAYEAVQRALDARAAPAPPQLRSLLLDIYTHALAMGVRRQMKLGSRNITLAGLLEDIAANTEHAMIDASAVRQDLVMLRRKVNRVVSFADRAVAHADRRSSRRPSLDELHAAVDALIGVHDTYATALRGARDRARGPDASHRGRA